MSQHNFLFGGTYIKIVSSPVDALTTELLETL